MSARILIAGIGNIFFGDDAFGVEVAQRLARRQLPEDVRVVDFGIRGLDLAYALLEPYEWVILVDAVPRGGQPGTLYVIEPELGDVTNQGAYAPRSPMIEPHALDPYQVLRLAQSLGGNVQHVLLIGCEPQPLTSEEDMQMQLSEPVQAAVDEAVRLIETEINGTRMTRVCHA